MTHRQARRRLGSRTHRRSGMKTQAIPNQSKPSNKGSLVKFRNPRRYPRHPRIAVQVAIMVRSNP